MGRPQKYSDCELREILMKVSMDNKEKITPSLLEKQTGVKRHVWLRRMRKEILLVNESTIFYSNDNLKDLPLPNIVNIVEKYYGNKTKLINELVWYNEKLSDAYSKISENNILRSKVKEMENSLLDKNMKIKELQNKCKHFEELYIISETNNNIFNGISVLKEKGKVIELQKQKEDMVSLDFDKEFPELFDNKE